MLRNKLYVYGDEDVRVPATFNYGQYMLQKFISYKDDVALLNADTNQSKTYRELAEEIVNIALSLTHMGIKKGDRVAFNTDSNTICEVVAVYYAIPCSGATMVPILGASKAMLIHKLQISKPRIMFCTPEVYKTYKDVLESAGCIEHYIVNSDENMEDAVTFKEFLTQRGRVEDFTAVPVDMTDLSSFWFSSGSTGMPKGIPITHWISLVRDTYLHKNKSTAIKFALTTAPFLSFIRKCLHNGVTLIHTSIDDIENFFKIIEKYKVTHASMLPFTLMKMSKSSNLDKYACRSLDTIQIGGSCFPAEPFKAIKRRLPTVRICQNYGTTEILNLCSDLDAPLGSKPGSVGCVTSGHVIKVVNVTTREPLGPNEIGEICGRGLTMFSGYYGGQSSRSSYMDEEGFFKTGDLGYYDEDKYFYIVDRIKDAIYVSGNMVKVLSIESLLLQHPSVSEAGVVGTPNDKYGEVPVAFVVLQPGADVTEQDLVDYVDGQVVDFMQLKGGVRIVSSLPRGAMLKIYKEALRKML